MGGPKAPAIQTSTYWDNDIIFEKGEKLLLLEKLKNSDKLTLIIDHPEYNQVIFNLFEYSCKIDGDEDKNPPSKTHPAVSRIFMKDWNDSRGNRFFQYSAMLSDVIVPSSSLFLSSEEKP